MDHSDGAGSGPSRPVTIYDVAREAGVATSTASRALSNPGRVSERTRAHVEEVARRLGYRPNRIAQALPSGRTRMLGLVVPDIANPHNARLIRGAEAQAAAAGYTLVIADSQEQPELEAAHVERLAPFVDGFVLSSRVDDAGLHGLRDRRPVVLFNRTLPELPSVCVDFDDSGRQVVEHLASLGHRTVAYLRGPATSWADATRRAALAVHCAGHGVALTLLGPFPPTLEAGAAAADAALATDATAVIAFNDLLAIGVLQRLEHRGVAVPDALSVVGGDDIFGATFCRPPLTTLASPADQAGRTLVDMLTGRIDATEVVLPAPLVARDSTGPVRG
ncbi:LacI family DNA-binding transcriptional regulator [Pseudonocardia sp. NPDC049154]|uniref:LacI family DNA-binding transcriptional regulator n=1 Tax=Pseudonocardia sp. NPDC049154 TaxID=3155501 RepID=UPI0033F5E9FB